MKVDTCNDCGCQKIAYKSNGSVYLGKCSKCGSIDIVHKELKEKSGDEQ